MALLLRVVQEREDAGDIEVGEPHGGGRNAVRVLEEPKQEPERITVRADGLGTDTFVAHEVVHEEALNERASGPRGAHRALSPLA